MRRMHNQWRYSIQDMIDWIDKNIENNPTLLEMSKQIGYSPCYCSNLFHQITGITLKKYLAGRKLSHVTIALRDTNQRILDIAIRYGYSSQEALTRAFVSAFGCTPNVYRKNPQPLKISVKQCVLFPENYINNGGIMMNNLKQANVRLEYIPAHKYVGIWETRALNYGEFWKYHDCDEICGLIESMRNVAHEVVGSHMAGWFNREGEKGYFYGFGVPMDYDGGIPDGFEVHEFPASTYLVFFHPPFDYVSECNEVMRRVEELAWNFNPSENEYWWISNGYSWNETECQVYQRHFPEVVGYEILRPIKKS